MRSVLVQPGGAALSLPAVLFDLDGTLTDSAPAIGGVLNSMRHERGLAPLPADRYRAWISLGAAELVGSALDRPGPAPADEVAAFRFRYADTRATAADLYPGVEDMLKQLHTAGHAMAVCSNKPQFLCEKVLLETGIISYFGAVVGGDAVRRSKPDPMHLLHALASICRDGQPFFFVGDSRIDADAAAAAGAMFVWASYGYGESAELAQRGVGVRNAAEIVPAVQLHRA